PMAQSLDLRNQTGRRGIGGGGKGISVGHTGLHDRGQRRLSKSILDGLHDRLPENKGGTRLNRGAPGADNKIFCGDIDMRIARDGTWFYCGTPIERKPLVGLFSTVLKRDRAGAFWLETPVEK